MNTSLHTAVRTALTAAALMTVPAAHAQMYRWTDPHGAVTFSNQLPSDTSTIRDLTVVLDTPRGTAESVKPGSNLPRAEHSAMPAPAEPPQASPRIASAPNAPEAVRDPCLRSADPKCIERNKGAYVPGRGYAPAAVGATPSAGAGGTLAGGSGPVAPARVTPPKSSFYALPPGSEAPVARKP